MASADSPFDLAAVRHPVVLLTPYYALRRRPREIKQVGPLHRNVEDEVRADQAELDRQLADEADQ